MTRNRLIRSAFSVALVFAFSAIANSSYAVLYLYEPFNYTSGTQLGGSGASMGSPIGQTGTYDASVGGGSYNWYARGTVSNYQSANDVQISSGSLSYPGLATSGGNSVSYGSADNSMGANATNLSRYADSIPLPVSVNSGSLYASFLITIKSRVYDGTTSTAYRTSIASFVTDTSTAGNAGGALAGQSGTGTVMPAGLWMRRDPGDATLNTTNFSPGKSSSDGVGNGVPGPTAGWQSTIAGATESNQTGAITGQTAVTDSSGSAISTTQTYFVVLKYSFDVLTPDPGTNNNQSDTVSLWMNPGSGTLGTATGEADASQAITGNLGSYYAALGALGTATSDAAAINSFALIGHRQNTGQTVSVDFDELRIGTTWQDVTPAGSAGVQGDYNGNGKVDAADYVLWRNGGPLLNEVDTPGTVNAADYTAWRARFGNTSGSGSVLGSGNVPEPGTAWLVLAAAATILRVQSRRR